MIEYQREQDSTTHPGRELEEKASSIVSPLWIWTLIGLEIIAMTI